MDFKKYQDALPERAASRLGYKCIISQGFLPRFSLTHGDLARYTQATPT